MHFIPYAVLVLCLAEFSHHVDARTLFVNQTLPGPYRIFKTEPDFIPSIINVTKNIDQSLLEPGYFFIAPHVGRHGYGPQIIDQDGELIWYGNPTVTHKQGRSALGMDFYVCDYLGQLQNHLCYSEGRPKGIRDEGIREGGANRVFNNAYQPVEEFEHMGNLTAPNPHEFNMLPGGESFLQSVYQKVKMDLRPYAGKKSGYVYNGCFQEIRIRTRLVEFEWCALDHMSVDESYLYLQVPGNTVNLSTTTGGRGTLQNPWDFMHLNSVDKNFEGDYLVSSRHMSSVLKIAGKHNVHGLSPGQIIWRLNGKYSDFDVDEEAIFTRQHHARYISTTENETIVSLFNNAFDGYTMASRNMSSAMVIKINNETMKATLERVYPHPDTLLSPAQGSVSALPGGNIHVGWGSHPEWSEFAKNGTLLYHAAAHVVSTKKVTNYRSFKSPWIGNPTSKPKLLAYSQSCATFSFIKNCSPLQAYVSWNGATEVVSWRFDLSSESQHGPWISSRTVKKAGFETHATLSSPELPRLSKFGRWVRVQALNTHGKMLQSTVAKTFVPIPSLREDCDIDGCYNPERFAYEEKLSRSIQCGTNMEHAAVTLFLIILGIETLIRLLRGLLVFLVDDSGDEDWMKSYGTVKI